jgi:hypothetical protein
MSITTDAEASTMKIESKAIDKKNKNVRAFRSSATILRLSVIVEYANLEKRQTK